MNVRHLIFLIACVPFCMAASQWPASKVTAPATATNYTPSAANVEAHLAGIDTALLSAGGGNPFESFRDSTVKGLDFDATADCYWRTSGIYNWSAEVGGVDGDGVGGTAGGYSTATTSGGNSAYIDCTGDGVATGTPTNEEACVESGERIKMSAMADIMLAVDNTCMPGGKVYLPMFPAKDHGLYHIDGCGAGDGVGTNGCPVLKTAPYHKQRAVQTFGGIELVGECRDPDGPLENGRTCVYLLFDTGPFQPVTASNGHDGNGDAVTISAFGGIYNGLKDNEQKCTPVSSTNPACVAGDVSKEVSVALGLNGQIKGAAGVNIVTGGSSICVDDDMTVNGRCTDEPRISCTTNVAGANDCIFGATDHGPCIDITTHVQNLIDAQPSTGPKNFITMIATVNNCGPDDVKCDGAYNKSIFPIWVSGTGASCASSTGTVLQLDVPETATIAWPFDMGEVLDAFTVAYVTVIDQELWWHEGGGFRDFSIMPAQWTERNSTNDSADCICTGLCSSDAEAACDATHAMPAGHAFRGGFENIGMYLFPFGNTPGLVDTVGGYQTKVKNNIFVHNRNQIADAGTFNFEGNRYIGNYCNNGSCVSAAFAANPTYDNEWWYGNWGTNRIYNMSGGRHLHMNNIKFIGNFAQQALINISTGSDGIIENVSGTGNHGAILAIEPNEDLRNWVFSKFNFTAHDPTAGGASSAVILLHDQNGNGCPGACTYQGTVENIKFDNWHVDIWEDDTAAVMLGGGTGDDVTAGNGGDSRSIDEQRSNISFENMHFNWPVDTTCDEGTPTCGFIMLGNRASADEHWSERLGDQFDSKDGVPRYRNITLNDRKIPDNDRAWMPFADAPTCDASTRGISFMQLDSGTQGTCDSGAGNDEQACCTCDGTAYTSC